MKKVLSLVLTVCMVLSLGIFGASAASTSGYADVDADTSYASAVKRVTEAGIMEGVSGGKFDPSGLVKRATVVTALGRMAQAAKKETRDFSDVAAGSYYAGYVGWAVENGIVLGDGAGHFNPDSYVTSAHLNLMLSRYAKLMGVTPTLYDTGAATVTRADFAQRLVAIMDGETVTTLAFAKTTGGEIMGYVEDGVSSFYGIPFATAERFQMPVAASWSGIKTCMMQGEVCPQGKTTMEGFDFMAYSTEMVENEDTMLNLNVWSTNMQNQKNELKPVVVWIHGGGYTTGGSLEKTMYDGANMADYGDVVFVSPNHRLNVLGYLDLSAYSEEYANSGNMGIADLVCALQWVRDNIKEFGGDPNNVTIIGQSGGGSKVTTLMGTPAAAGLFHKAVAISGGSAKVTQTTEATQAKAALVLKELGITAANIKDIESVPYDELYAAYKKVGYSAGPTVDGAYIPTGTYEMSKNIPFLCGNVFSEFSTNVGAILFAGNIYGINANLIPNISEEQTIATLAAGKFDGDKEKAAAAVKLFKEAYPGHNVAEVLYINNRSAGMSCYPLLSAMESYGGTCYTYLQACSYPFFEGITPIHTAGDVPLWFYNVDEIPAWVSGETAKFEALSGQMATALATFARTGNPSTKDLTWESWSTAGDGVMVFDATNGYTSTMRYHHEDALFNALLGR